MALKSFRKLKSVLPFSFYDENFFDKDYFEDGVASGKSGYNGYDNKKFKVLSSDIIKMFGPKNVLDDSLYDMISQIVKGEDYTKHDEITEEISKVELDSAINRIVKGYGYDNPGKTTIVKDNTEEPKLIEQSNELENDISLPIEPKYRSDNHDYSSQIDSQPEFVATEDNLIIEVEDTTLENGDRFIDSALLDKLNQLEEKIAKLSNKAPEITDDYQDDLLVRLKKLENKVDDVSNTQPKNQTDEVKYSIDGYEEEIPSYENDEYIYHIEEEENDDYVLSYELKPERELEPEPEIQQDEYIESLATDDEYSNNETTEVTEVVEDVLEEEVIEDVEEPSVDSYIEEIHSAKGKDNFKVRRKRTVIPIVVFWNALVIGCLINPVEGTLLLSNVLIKKSLNELMLRLSCTQDGT